MTVMLLPDAPTLPEGTVPVDPNGLLARVHRHCEAHGADAVCVARDPDGARLVYWCERGEHHLRAR